MNLIKFERPRQHRAITNVFDDFFGRSFPEIFNHEVSFNSPSTNIREDETGYTIELAAPGLNKDDFNIKVEKDQLIISSESKNETEETSKNGKYTRREFNYSSFRKSFHLNEKIDSEKINAAYENGVLNIRLEKREEAKTKEPITINIQ